MKAVLLISGLGYVAAAYVAWNEISLVPILLWLGNHLSMKYIGGIGFGISAVLTLTSYVATIVEGHMQKHLAKKRIP